MNYIILDLEWDSSYYKKKGGFINQILQIGAVKLNESFEITDIFKTSGCPLARVMRKELKDRKIKIRCK